MPRYREEQIVAAAHLYYVEGQTHEEIAGRLNTSRVAVTRMIRRAREENIVQITIKRPLPVDFQLSLELEKRFGLRSVKIVPTMEDPDETLDAVGRAGAEMLASLLRPGLRIGAAWSRTVSAILPHVKQPHPHVECRVNDLAGTYLAPNIPYSVSWQLAEKLKVPLVSIPVPVLLKSEETKKIMLEEDMIHTGLVKALDVDIALVGIGNVSGTSTLVTSGFLDDAHIKEIRGKGAVGDILMRYFDRNGRHVPMSFEDRVVSPKWEEIGRLRNVVALAFGAEKSGPIRAAIAGGLIHGLVTDRKMAELLLETVV